MSDAVAWILVVTFLIQTIAFGTFIVGDSVTNRRLRRIAEELVMLRSFAQRQSCDASATCEAGDAK